MRKKKKQPELPNRGLSPILPDYDESEGYFNHLSQGQGQVNPVASTGDAIGESFNLEEEVN